MKLLRKYAVGMLLLTVMTFAAACGSTDDRDGAADAVEENGTAAEEAGDGGISVDDILFDTDGDGVYDHTDVDGDGLLEEIGRDANDVVDDVVDGLTGDDMQDGETDGGMDGTVEDTVVEENGAVKN